MQGAVVNISSTAARVPRGGNPAYGVAKAAQDRLTQDLAFELASKGVRVNSVLPGESLSISLNCKNILIMLRPKSCAAIGETSGLSCRLDYIGFQRPSASTWCSGGASVVLSLIAHLAMDLQ